MCGRNELEVFCLFEMQIVLKIIIIYANLPYPHPLPTFPTKKVTQ